MKSTARFLASWALGAALPALVISVWWLLSRPWSTLYHSWWLLLLVFACTLVALLLLHGPVYLIVDHLAGGRARRVTCVAVPGALSFTPVFFMSLVLMGDHDSPTGLIGKLSESLSLHPEALLWYFAFTLGGAVFLLCSGLSHRHAQTQPAGAVGLDA